jgi:RNA polymerase primary sigma factor
MVDMLNKMNTVEKALTQELGRAPRACELAERMKTKPEKIRQLRELRQQVVSLDSAVSEDNDTTIEEITSDTSIESPVETVGRKILKGTVREALSVLNDREKIVIALRYGLGDDNPRTLEEIGKVFNVTREHIRKIEIEALQKLRESDSLGKLAALAAEM